MRICTYLTFNGNCREAMTFYKECLGGELTFQTIGESLRSKKMPERMKNCILQATLTKGSLILMGSDMVGENGLIKGNSVSLLLNCKSAKEIKTYYKKLSLGGKANHSVGETFFGALFGGLTDKFGNHWLLNYKKR